MSDDDPRTLLDAPQVDAAGEVEVSPCQGCGTLAGAEGPCPVCGLLPVDDRLGQVVAGRYVLESLLGAGGMGRVYRARHVELGEQVAVKFLLAEWTARPEMRARFRREAVVLARLRHPNIVSVIDYGEHQGELFLVMELLRGFSLDTQVMAGGLTMPVPRVVSVIDQVLQVLEAAHAMGVVHRDLKPENVMLLDAGDRTDKVKVLDFGIAAFDDERTVEKLTRTGTVRGTPQYMSPEQCVGRNLGAPTDIYAVGTMLYELLVGEAPFNGQSVAEVLSQQMFNQPPPFSERPPSREVPPGLEALMLRALSKRPEQRPTAAEFRDALSLCARGSDPLSLAARDAVERARSAGLSRDDRALAPDRVAPVEGRANEAGPSPRVAMWGFSAERGAALRNALAAHGVTTYPVRGEGLTEMAPDRMPWRAVLIAGDAAADERTRWVRSRADAELSRLPTLVLDLPRAAEAAAMIRSGASDATLSSVDDAAVCQKVLRALRRGR
ncbi:MAG: serine/threonine protein kinase [Myxococcaceae bacterium]|nr:MAG: serine/threonine protein kinase [Myxococcaceae bacterium]